MRGARCLRKKYEGKKKRQKKKKTVWGDLEKKKVCKWEKSKRGRKRERKKKWEILRKGLRQNERERERKKEKDTLRVIDRKKLEREREGGGQKV